ncbi:inactive TPR repeat-containing thioredoxin TTL3-like [Pyrus ussuriensis x Pyrus communis]|uniref:Inactive TPR repeat-containing thioredoxin TTL3-like n=1 Tax=Pyrus ussuriensis x Pyrus communis TaxID=2448454 RepID=A0A5N5HMD4_9ROSA|nr:inactive TPR repeat-containing thioredoxin TTL3-like [Pyrus ussuriensis x Pyrus communis]
MADMAKYKVGNELGCGFMGGIFQCSSYWPRKSSVHSLPSNTSTNDLNAPISEYCSSKYNESKNQQTESTEGSATVISLNSGKPSPNLDSKHAGKPSLNHPGPSACHQKVQPRRHSDAARSSIFSSNGAGQIKVSQHPDLAKEMKLRRASTASSAELSRKISDHQQANETEAPVQATSSSLIFTGQSRNLRKPGFTNQIASNSPSAISTKTLAYHPRNLEDSNSTPSRKNGFGKLGGNGVMGNIVRRNSDDPEVLKSMGNEAYKGDRFEEALGLYDRAIALDSNKAAYYSNKAAALIGLGRLIDAVFECKEAIQIEPSYHKAHHRLATTYLRLGEAEKALDHYKHSGPYAYSKDVDQCQALQKCLSRCIEAQKLQEWNGLLNETQLAISSGANSAPQVFALQAEALLKLQRHQEAYATYQNRPSFGTDICTKFFGVANSAYLLMIGAQVYLAAGRFEDAIGAAQNAERLNPCDKNVGMVVKRARAVASARVSGNLLFKVSKFSEACVVYSQGLQHDPHNSILLCNRAACRSKLGQFEKAIEDCNAALDLQPSYSKARLRRADCNAKLERWGAAIQDYEMLIRETPGDEEVGKALFEAKIQLKKQHDEDVEDAKLGSNLVLVTSNEHFRHFVTSPGMSVVLFCNKTKQKEVFQALHQVCKRFPSVNFLKVEVEDHPYLAKMEDVSTIPAFKIYKNGSMVKEIPGKNHELLESSVKLYSG